MVLGNHPISVGWSAEDLLSKQQQHRKLSSTSSLIMWTKMLAIALKRRIGLLVFKSSIRKSLARSCPSPIPQSGKAADQVNYYSALIDDGDKPYLLVTGIGDTHIQGKLWYQDEHMYAGVIRVQMAYAATLSLKIVHYIGPEEIVYTSAFRLWLGEATRIPHLFLALRRTWANLTRTLFHQRSRLNVDRDKLLEYVVDEYAVSGSKFGAGAVLTSMYNYRWHSHPGANSARKRTEFLLLSLVLTGDLQCSEDGQQFWVVPAGAFKSLSEIQQARQLHRQSLRIQRSIITLTFGSLIAALIQAGVIKSPPIIKADCILENGVAKDCTVRYKLFPNRILEGINRMIPSD